jgi:uracil-DNA glycosylase
MFLGEAPGSLENKTGYPFVGVAGRVLNTMFNLCHYPFDYLITNMVCCRPCNVIYLEDSAHDIPFSELVDGEDYEIHDWNRDPTPAEMLHCRSHITQLIKEYDPHGLVRLGKIATNFPSPLPSIELHHPAYLARMEYPLLTAIEEVEKLENFIKEIHQ